MINHEALALVSHPDLVFDVRTAYRMGARPESSKLSRRLRSYRLKLRGRSDHTVVTEEVKIASLSAICLWENNVRGPLPRNDELRDFLQ